eukprot:3016790-Rhodomonas_salina.3
MSSTGPATLHHGRLLAHYRWGYIRRHRYEDLVPASAMPNSMPMLTVHVLVTMAQSLQCLIQVSSVLILHARCATDGADILGCCQAAQNLCTSALVAMPLSTSSACIRLNMPGPATINLRAYALHGPDTAGCAFQGVCRACNRHCARFFARKNAPRWPSSSPKGRCIRSLSLFYLSISVSLSLSIFLSSLPPSLLSSRICLPAPIILCPSFFMLLPPFSRRSKRYDPFAMRSSLTFKAAAPSFKSFRTALRDQVLTVTGRVALPSDPTDVAYAQ